MRDIHFKIGDLCWICIYDASNKKTLTVCGTIVQYVSREYVEVLAVSKIFKRKIYEINKFENKDDFLPWPFDYKST
jgi:hypothetical protein